MLPKLHPSKKYDHGTQTDHMDYFDVSQETKLALMEREKDKFRQSYQMEKDINKELHVSLEQLKRDAEKLEKQYTKLSNDAEIALASERLATKTVYDQKKMIDALKQQCVKLESDLEKITVKYSKVERDYEVLSKTVTAAEEIRQKTQPKIDPIVYLESQWAKDRTKYYTETERLKNQVESLSRQNQMLKTELESRVVGMPEPAQYAETIAKLSIFMDENKKLKEEKRGLTSGNVNLEAQIEKLQTLQSTRQTQLKNAQMQVSLLRKEVEKKESVIKEQTTRLEKVLRTVQVLESKNKLESGSIHSKEILLHDLKQKVQVLESKVALANKDTELIQSLQTSIQKMKQELVRKQQLVTHWKEKVGKLEQELSSCKSSTANMVDKKVFTALEHNLKVCKESQQKLNQTLDRYVFREQQFNNVLEQFVSAYSSTYVLESTPQIPGVDPKTVDQMVQSLSRKILDVDWKDLSSPTNTENVTRQLQEMYDFFNLA